MEKKTAVNHVTFVKVEKNQKSNDEILVPSSIHQIAYSNIENYKRVIYSDF